MVDVVVDVFFHDGALVDHSALFGCVPLERRLGRGRRTGGMTYQCIAILIDLPFEQGSVFRLVGMSLADSGDGDELFGERGLSKMPS